MARIRTVKPEFWEDEVVGVLPRDARLLFIATFNLADDEGLLRWAPAYLKASAFMYDDDVTVSDVAKLMQCLADAGLLFPYIGGVARQQMAMVVNFRKHQNINRPQKSKLPPPSLQSGEVRRVYGRRDNWTCRLCGGGIPERPVSTAAHNLAIGRIRPQSAGGTDHPSNVRAVHQVCGEGHWDGSEGEFVAPGGLAGLDDSLSEALNHSMNDSLNHSVNESGRGVTAPPYVYTQSDICSVSGSVNDSLTNSLGEGKGREGNREGKGRETPLPPAAESTHAPAAVVAERPLPDRMLAAWWEKFGRHTAQSKKTARAAIAQALDNGLDSHELWAALLRLGDTSKPITGGTLQFALSDVRKSAAMSNVIHLPTGQTLVGGDARFAAHAALTAQLAAEEARESS